MFEQLEPYLLLIICIGFMLITNQIYPWLMWVQVFWLISIMWMGISAMILVDAGNSIMFNENYIFPIICIIFTILIQYYHIAENISYKKKNK